VGGKVKYLELIHCEANIKISEVCPWAIETANKQNLFITPKTVFLLEVNYDAYVAVLD
jgi:hypothetical protein